FVDNQSSSFGSVFMEKGNVTHFFRECSITGFKGWGVFIAGCDGIHFPNSHVEDNVSNSHSYIGITDCRGCTFDGMWFEENEISSSGALLQWFMYISTQCNAIAVRDCTFVRKTNTNVS